MNEDDLSVRLIKLGGKERQEGITQLYNRYAMKIIRYYEKRGMDQDEAKALMHDVFAKVIDKINTYNAEGNFRAWLWTISRNTLRDHYKRSSNKPTYVELEENLEAGVEAILPFDPTED